jgi:hypothetical protein
LNQMPRIKSLQFYMLGKKTPQDCVNETLWHSPPVAGENGGGNRGRDTMGRSAERPFAGELHTGREDRARSQSLPGQSLPGSSSRAAGRSTPHGAAEDQDSRWDEFRDEAVNALGGLAAAIPLLFIVVSLYAN